MAREVKVSGRTVYLPDRDEWEPVPTLWRCPSCGVETKSQERAEKLGHRRPPHKIGMCFTKMEMVKPEEPRAGPYALVSFDVSGFVEHEIRCSGCGKIATGPDATPTSPGRYHYVPAPGGWRRCGEWR
jgi:hypothetical protein